MSLVDSRKYTSVANQDILTRLEKIFREADQMDENIAEFGLLSQSLRVGSTWLPLNL